MNTEAFDAGLQAWYSPGVVKIKSFDNVQAVNYEGLKGRVLSSSVAPKPEQPEYSAMLAELETLFHNHQANGTVAIEYECRMCYGQFH